MTGISHATSQFSCPVYNTCAYNSTPRKTTSNNLHIIPPISSSSTLHLQNISLILPTTHLLKHRVYSSSTDKSVSSGFNGNGFIAGLLSGGMITSLAYRGVNVQSILAVGGVATALAARHIIGNILSGMMLQKLKLLSIGDIVRVGSVGGNVLDVGLTTTLLLSGEMFVTVVPNLLFFSEGFVKAYWPGWHAMVWKINMKIDEIEKIPEILEEIKKMMKSNSNVYMETEQPYCYVSQVEQSFAELTLGCNLKMTRRDMLELAERDVREQSVKIIEKHGAKFAWGT